MIPFQRQISSASGHCFGMDPSSLVPSIQHHDASEAPGLVIIFKVMGEPMIWDMGPTHRSWEKTSADEENYDGKYGGKGR